MSTMLAPTLRTPPTGTGATGDDTAAERLLAEAQAARSRPTWGDVFRFLVVGAILTLILGYLMLRGRLPQRLSLRSAVANRCRRLWRFVTGRH